MLFLTVLLLFLPHQLLSLSHKIPQVKVKSYKQPLEVKTIADGKLFLLKLTHVSYEISGKIYQIANTSPAIPYNTSQYLESNSCQFYGTNLQVLLSQELEYIEDTFISFVAVRSHNVYAIYKQSTILQRFSFTNKSIQYQENYKIEDLGFNGFEGYGFVEINSMVLFTNGSRIIGLPFSQPNQFEAYTLSSLSSNFGRFQKIKPAVNQNQFLMIWQQRVQLYHFINNMLNLLQQHTCSSPLYYNDGIISTKQTIIMLTDKLLLIYQDNKPKNITLQSKCKSLSMLADTIHMLCLQNDVQYIGEYQYDENQLIVNRYYVDLQGITTIHPFGQNSDKMIIIGQNQMKIIPHGVNRQVILEMNSSENEEIYSSFGMQNIVTVKSYSTNLSTFAVGTNYQGFKLLRIEQIPPQIECTMIKSQSETRTLLIALNITCVPSSLTTICQHLMLYEFKIKSTEIEKKVSIIVFVMIIFLILTIILIVLGFAFKYYTRHTQAISKIALKIRSLKNKKKTTIKEI